MDVVTVDRGEVIAYRFRRHQLDRPDRSAAASQVDLLDLGVQDTGTDGSGWALAVRGARPSRRDDLLLAWTLRGAPHAYRRRDVAAVAAATAPFSEADAASRVFDASRALRDGGIPVLDALTTVAREMRDIARRPMTKGDMSTELATRLSRPFLRFCRACNATHTYEQTFRLAALQAGLELEPGTSPPVLRRIPRFRAPIYARLGTAAQPRFDVIRGYLRFYGPAPVKAIAAYLDAPVREVSANLPDDAVEVEVEGLDLKPKRYVLADDVDALVRATGRTAGGVVRLVGSHDPYLQLRDRELLVDDPAKQKDLWRVLGRAGAVLVDGEVVGTWRPRAAGTSLTINVEPWISVDRKLRTAVRDQAERLAAHREVRLTKVDGL